MSHLVKFDADKKDNIYTEVDIEKTGSLDNYFLLPTISVISICFTLTISSIL